LAANRKEGLKDFRVTTKREPDPKTGTSLSRNNVPKLPSVLRAWE